MLLQRMAQRIERAATLLARLAGVDGQRLLDGQIMLIPPPGKCRYVMRSERDEGVLSIAFGGKESAVGRTLEQHDLICPHAPIRERFTKIFGYGPEIFPDDNAFMSPAAQRGNRQQGFEGKTDVGAAVRAYAVGNEIETLQAQDVVQPDCPGVTHGGLQHAAERLELPLFETNRIESRQAPVLPGGIERVWRRADRHARQDRILIGPGVEAIAANADRNVEVEPERQAASAGSRTTAVELLVGHPLHELDELDACRLGSPEPVERFFLGRTPLLRPFPPRMSEFPAQPLETCKAGEGGPVGLSKPIE